MARVVIIGPAHPLRGGLATFNQRLAKQFNDEGHSCSIYSFSLQYPSFLFPGKTQYTDEPSPENLSIHSVINSINPFNWIKIGNRLKKERPDMIIVRFWLPFMGPALGTILRRVRKNKHTKIICVADNVIPHEKRFGDKPFTKYFLKSCDAFITMSEKVMEDLRKFQPAKPARVVSHPLYDNFGEKISKEAARDKLQIGTGDFIILFFGFIRAYKGLDILLDAVKILKDSAHPAFPFKVLVAGEFYEDRKKYDEQINRLGISDNLILHTDFISDSEVKYYFCASDVLVQPYINATQSGVTPLAFHFDLPTIVTDVGNLAKMLSPSMGGLVSNEATPESIAGKIKEYYSLNGKEHYLPMLLQEKKKYAWSELSRTIMILANE